VVAKEEEENGSGLYWPPALIGLLEHFNISINLTCVEEFLLYNLISIAYAKKEQKRETLNIFEVAKMIPKVHLLLKLED